MTYEDFEDYIEEDPNNHINVASATHVDVDGMTENEDAYLYDDKGADHFTDFEHLIDVKAISSVGPNGTGGYCWVLANTVDDWRGIYNADGDLLSVLLIYWAPAPSGWRIYLQEVDGGNYYATYQPITVNTWYYLTIERSGTALTCKVYSDSARTNLLFTLSLTLHAPVTDFQYVYAVQSDNRTQPDTITFDVEKLALQEIPEVPRYGLRNLPMEEEWG